MSRIKQALKGPVASFQRRYIPLLMIYFAYGLSGFSSIALSFWKKEQLGLSAEQLLAIAAWAFVPWTAKIIFGQFVDSVRILGSRRRIYIFIGAAFMVLGTCTLAGLAGRHSWIMWLGDEYRILLLASVFTALGFVIQDVTADTMTTEVVDRQEIIKGQRVDRSPADIQSELAAVQVMGRLALYFASFLVAGLGGWLAQHYAYESIFWWQLIIPLISCLGAILVRLDPVDEEEIKPLDLRILGGGTAFIAFSVIMGWSDFAYAQEVVFFVSAAFLALMMGFLLKDMPLSVRKTLALTMLALFLYRATPPVGPGLNWWAIDVLGFEPAFFGVLAQIGAVTGLGVLWLLSDLITRREIKTTLIILILIETALFLPDLLMYHGVHKAMGVDARFLAMFDAAAESPLVSISMVLVLSLIAFHAPAGNRGTWFAIAASIVNLALTAGNLLSKYLNKLYVITREVKNDAGAVVTPADYSQLGELLIIVLLITFTVPMLAVMTLIKKTPVQSQAQH